MTSKLPKAKKMEVPKTISVKIDDGILVCTDKKNAPVYALFAHLLASMNDKNCVEALRLLADMHGYEIEVEG